MVGNEQAGSLTASRFFRLTAQQDADALRAIFADAAEIWHPLAGTIGPDAYVDLLRKAWNFGGTMTLEETGRIAQGPRTAVQMRASCGLPSGKSYRNEYCFVFDVLEERIVRLSEYADTAPAIAAFGT